MLRLRKVLQSGRRMGIRVDLVVSLSSSLSAWSFSSLGLGVVVVARGLLLGQSHLHT